MITDIQIVSYKDSMLWYSKYVGGIYEVVEYDALRNMYMVITPTGRNIVYEEDCVPWTMEWNAERAMRAVDTAVNNPAHYNSGSIECIEAIEAALTPEEFEGYLKGNNIKYVWRCNHKGSKKKDLDKANWYLQRLIGKQ